MDWVLTRAQKEKLTSARKLASSGHVAVHHTGHRA